MQCCAQKGYLIKVSNRKTPSFSNATVSQKATKYMVTVEVDLCAENFSRQLVDGEDAPELFLLAPRLGVNPDKLIIAMAHGPAGGNPICHASFNDMTMARERFAWAADDADPNWFDENVV